MIDCHCHIDLYENPIQIAEESERLNILTIGMTNIPSHFEMGYPHLLQYKKVRLALGMHPLSANEHKKELSLFFKNLHKTSYIGEVGLDFSREGMSTKSIQVDTFKKILNELKGQKKILSLHSRKAEREVLNLLRLNDIALAIFHWYSGPVSLIEEIISEGYYFSINTAMIKSKSGQNIIKNIPLNKVLTESDGPFIMTNGKPCKPSDLRTVYSYLSTLYNQPFDVVESQIYNNFMRLINQIRK